jgi:hypothetical protein
LNTTRYSQDFAMMHKPSAAASVKIGSILSEEFRQSSFSAAHNWQYTDRYILRLFLFAVAAGSLSFFVRQFQF